MLAAFRVPLGLVLAGAALFVPSAAHAESSSSNRLPAAWEHRFHVRSATADPDRDGLDNYGEWRSHTNPKRADTDRDGVDDASEDFDRDGLDNGAEEQTGTDPGRRDSDGDGRPDGREDFDRDGLPNAVEQQLGDDPADPDTDGDGIRDGKENAGRVVAWDADSGDLTIRLAATGRTVTGQVDDATDVTCDGADGYLSGDGSSDGTDDPSADDPSADDSTDDTPDASAASVLSDYTADDPSADDPAAADGSGDSTTFDEACFNDVLAPGALVHEAEFTTDADGTVFDTVALVDDSVQD